MSSVIKSSRAVVENTKVSITVPPKDIFFTGPVFEEKNIEEQMQPLGSFISPEEEAEELLETAKRKAEQIIEHANTEAKSILDAANTQAENLRAEAKADGYNRGYKDAYGKGEQEVYLLKTEAQAIVEEAKKEKAQILQQIEPEVVSLIVDILKHVSEEQIQVNPDMILSMIKKGLQEAPVQEGTVSIHVSGADFEFVNENREKIKSFVDSTITIELVKDVSLNQGDCVIQTPFGDIDSSLDSQLDFLTKDLKKILNSSI